MIKHVSYEETDEYLTYEMERLIKFHEQYNDLPDFHKIERFNVSDSAINTFFRDTLILEPADNEMVPFRELHFSILHDSVYYEVVLSHLLLGDDDIAEGSATIILVLILLLFGGLFLIIVIVSKQAWRPFYGTLNSIKKFGLNKERITLKSSNIDEFNSLNTIIEQLFDKITDDYTRMKEFNENASHELQSHLAVIRSKMESILNALPEDNQIVNDTQSAYIAVNHLSQVQRSLLLLSRIGNNEFSTNIETNIKTHVIAAIDLFAEAANLRGIRLSEELTDSVVIMDPGLAKILINNIIKNAVKHNIDNGFIDIKLCNGALSVLNNGADSDVDPAEMMKRFNKGKTGNYGIGLAIVSQICDIYHFKVSYDITNSTHRIKLDFNQPS